MIYLNDTLEALDVALNRRDTEQVYRLSQLVCLEYEQALARQKATAKSELRFRLVTSVICIALALLI